MKSYEMEVVEIVSNASIAHENMGDGRNIPLVILDTSNRPDVEILVKNHNSYGQGEVKSTWARFDKNKNMIGLHLVFKKPNECNVLLNFDITVSGVLIDLIMSSQALYIQPGRPGDRLSNTMNAERMVIEIPTDEFRMEWENIYYTQMVKHIKKKHRVSKKKAEKITEELIKELRVINEIRVPKK